MTHFIGGGQRSHAVMRAAITGNMEKHTEPSARAVRPAARASYPTMRAISCTKVCASRELVDAERSWESFAWRQGCVDTCALRGILGLDMVGDLEIERLEGKSKR
jgi:hypothetical protein